VNIATLAEQIAKMDDVRGCEVAANATLDIWAETVSEPGKAPQVQILGKTSYVKDAPIAIFRKLGFETQRGEDTNLVANFLAAHGWTEWEETKGGRFVDNSEPAVLYRHGQELRRRFLAGERGILAAMLANVTRLWDAYYATYPPQIGNTRLLCEFLSLNPDIAQEYIHWYVSRGYGHGVPHCFCWQRGSRVWFWANAGGDKYRPKPWMEEFHEGIRPEVILLRFKASKQTVKVPPDTNSYVELADALVARDVGRVEAAIRRWGSVQFFAQADVATANHPEGCLLGRHYTQWVPIVKRLRQVGRDDAAEILLLALLPVIEHSEKEGVIPPWYYDQLCVIYRKSKQSDKEAGIIQRLEKVRPNLLRKDTTARAKANHPGAK
jgi:hypothetical protein